MGEALRMITRLRADPDNDFPPKASLHIHDCADILGIGDLIGRHNCVGHAPRQNRRCRNPVNKDNRARASQIINDIDRLRIGSKRLQPLIEELACRLLCLRNHQNQVDTVAAVWMLRLYYELDILPKGSQRKAKKILDNRDVEMQETRTSRSRGPTVAADPGPVTYAFESLNSAIGDPAGEVSRPPKARSKSLQEDAKPSASKGRSPLGRSSKEAQVTVRTREVKSQQEDDSPAAKVEVNPSHIVQVPRETPVENQEKEEEQQQLTLESIPLHATATDESACAMPSTTETTSPTAPSALSSRTSVLSLTMAPSIAISVPPNLTDSILNTSEVVIEQPTLSLPDLDLGIPDAPPSPSLSLRLNHAPLVDEHEDSIALDSDSDSQTEDMSRSSSPSPTIGTADTSFASSMSPEPAAHQAEAVLKHCEDGASKQDSPQEDQGAAELAKGKGGEHPLARLEDRESDAQDDGEEGTSPLDEGSLGTLPKSSSAANPISPGTSSHEQDDDHIRDLGHGYITSLSTTSYTYNYATRRPHHAQPHPQPTFHREHISLQDSSLSLPRAFTSPSTFSLPAMSPQQDLQPPTPHPFPPYEGTATEAGLVHASLTAASAAVSCVDLPALSGLPVDGDAQSSSRGRRRKRDRAMEWGRGKLALLRDRGMDWKVGTRRKGSVEEGP